MGADEFDSSGTESPPEEQEEASETEQNVEGEALFEDLDRRLVIVSRKTWYALFGVSLFIFYFIYWALFGSITIYIEGKGIVMNRAGVFVAQSRTSGTLQNIVVSIGDLVHEGDLLADIYIPELELSLETAKIREKVEKEDYLRLKKMIEEESSAEKIATESKIHAKQFSLEQAEKDLPGIKESLERKKKLYEEGLIRSSIYSDAENSLKNKLSEIESLKAEIAALNAELIRGYRTEELRSKEDKWKRAEEEVTKIELKKSFTVIYAPADGKVLSIQYQKGALVQEGSPVFWLEHLDKTEEETQFVIPSFIPLDKGKRVSLNAPAYAMLSSVNKDEYGVLKGKVISISPYPISSQTLNNLIHNKGLVEYLTQGETAAIQVVIEPKKDPGTPTGYEWTSREGPPEQIRTGTVCSIRIAVEKLRPIYYAFPALDIKSVMGITPHKRPEEVTSQNAN